ncbi:MAG: DUF4351 domain-containing protein [Cyanobium sp.]
MGSSPASPVGPAIRLHQRRCGILPSSLQTRIEALPLAALEELSIASRGLHGNDDLNASQSPRSGS